MTVKEELKILAARHSWAFEELVYDSKMTEANRITSAGINESFRYLKEELGSSRAVLDMLSDLILRQRVPRKARHDITAGHRGSKETSYRKM